ncbi:hypothetical protein C482_00280 [Natrialba chahannaoensis JCM 10990]|uniref:Uncharacterized protein n=1 Tax=Natrialba chahannaoensis JCM 10990 TaxID=1227492 RepID=M0B6R5_9EURY|nr:hypothetical protein C482_00280 [Natrialba chahannaoensis JCM 10990]
MYNKSVHHQWRRIDGIYRHASGGPCESFGASEPLRHDRRETHGDTTAGTVSSSTDHMAIGADEPPG